MKRRRRGMTKTQVSKSASQQVEICGPRLSTFNLRLATRLLIAVLFLGALTPNVSLAAKQPGKFAGAEQESVPRDMKQGKVVQLLQEQVAQQQKQIDQLRATLEEQKRLLELIVRSLPPSKVESLQPGASGNVTSVRALASASERALSGAGATAGPLGGTTPAVEEEIRQQADKVNGLAQKVDEALKNLGGLRFSGDFRFRADAQIRSSNEVAGPLQNIRSRYRLRLNVDKEWDPKFRFHMQLSTGPLSNAITNDQDFGGIVTKHSFSIAEAYIGFRPSSTFEMRGGRMEEAFADNMRFLWDDDVRFNGFQQSLTLPVRSEAVKSLEFRMTEYFLSNPNIVILAPSSPFVAAGFQPATKVRDALLFHPGVVVKGDLGNRWTHQLIGDVQIYRNPNQIQLSSVANGFPVLVSNALGIALSGPLGGLGNATTTSGGAIYSAPHFQIARFAYRLENKGVKLGTREMPWWLDFQVARNMGTSKLRDAVMASANLGTVKGPRDVRLLYQFAIKDANSLISQFTDDDLGTGSGVNIAVHAFRFDLGLTRFLQWQNLLFVQDERRASNPAEQLFVPLQRGARTTFRYLGQLSFTF